MRGVLRPPRPVRRAQREDEGQARPPELRLERRALTIDTVGDDRAEGHAQVQGALNEVDRELRLGAQSGILLALGQAGGGRVGHDVQRVVGALVGP